MDGTDLPEELEVYKDDIDIYIPTKASTLNASRCYTSTKSKTSKHSTNYKGNQCKNECTKMQNPRHHAYAHFLQENGQLYAWSFNEGSAAESNNTCTCVCSIMGEISLGKEMLSEVVH